MYNKTGCDLVMLGKRFIWNPFVFHWNFYRILRRKVHCNLFSWGKMDVMLRHIRMIIAGSQKSELLAMQRSKKTQHGIWTECMRVLNSELNVTGLSRMHRQRAKNLLLYNMKESWPKMGSTISIDLHGMTVSEAKSELLKCLKKLSTKRKRTWSNSRLSSWTGDS